MGNVPRPTCELCGNYHVDGPTSRRCYYHELRDALGDDLKPTKEQDAALRWLASWDRPTVTPIAELFRKLRGGS